MTRRRKGVAGLRAVVALLLALLQLIASVPASAQAAYETDYRWDAMGRLTGVVQPDADGASPFAYPATRYTWDSDGQLTKVETGWLSAWPGSTVPSGWSGFTIQKTTNFTYDPVGNRTDERLSGGGAVQQVTQYSYDPGDRLTCTALRMNLSAIPPAGSDACQPGTALGYAQGSDGPDRITKSIYDAADEVLQVRKAVGVTGLEQAYVTYTYTPNGKQQDVIDANGNHAKLTYDLFDRKYQWQFPSSGTPPSGFDGSTPSTAVATAGAVNPNDYEQWTYDADGNLYIDRKRDGRSVVLNYDALNRRYTRNYRNASGVDDPTSTWVYYAYDLRGLQTGATLGSTSGAGVTDTFDNAGRLQSATDTTGGAALTLNYLYDANSNRIRITHPDGQYFVYDYDQLNRVKDIKENGGTALVTITYYNTGERQSLTRAGGSVTSYGYDGISRLTSLAHSFVGGSGNVTIGFPAYNAASQITTLTHDNSAYIYTDTPTYTRPYSINGLNQYSQTGPAASPTTIFGYDADGNLLTSTDTASNVTTTYSYDVENRLTGASGGLTATLSYDPNGRLYQTSGTNGTTRLLYDGDALVAEYSGSTLLRRYVHGPGIDEPLVWYEGAGVGSANRQFLHADNEGSIIAVSNSSGGSMQTNTYDEYGIPGARNSSLANQRFAYTGQILIPELGLYHYKARAYSPILGRFMQTDPVGYEDQVNLYAYVGDDPIDGRDPSGAVGADLAMDQLAQQFASGQITEREYKERTNAVATGGAIGAAIVAVAYVTKGFGILPLLRAILREAPEEVAPAARGMQNPATRAAVENGNNAHRALAERVEAKGMTANPTGLRANGRVVKPDALTRRGNPIEFKPNTPSGIRKGEQQLPKYEEATGKKGRVVCYDPRSYNIVPCGS